MHKYLQDFKINNLEKFRNVKIPTENRNKIHKITIILFTRYSKIIQ